MNLKSYNSYYLLEIGNIIFLSYVILIQGVPKVSLDFVFVIFSGSGARTEELLTFIQQPWKFAT